MAKKGLGKGLGSLIPQKASITKNVDAQNGKKTDTIAKNINTEAAMLTQPVPQTAVKAAPEINLLGSRQVMVLPHGSVMPNPKQPRTIFGHNEMEELIASVKEHGILQPIVVKQPIDEKYEIIMGERRWRAAKMAGLKEVPVIVESKNLDDKETFELAIIENVQRKDLTPIEEAQAYYRLIEEFDMTQEEVAKKIGKSRSSIANFVRLLSLPDEIKEAIQNNKLSMGHAKTLLSLESPAKQLDMYRKIMMNNMSVRETERIIKKNQQKNIQKEDSKPEGLNRMESILRDSLKTKVSIDTSGSKGKITIEYYSPEELRQIISTITR